MENSRSCWKDLGNSRSYGKIWKIPDLAGKIWKIQDLAGKIGKFKFLPARFGNFKILKLTRVNSPLLTYRLVEREERTTLNSIPQQKEYLIYGDLTINGYHRFADKGKKHVIAI